MTARQPYRHRLNYRGRWGPTDQEAVPDFM